VLWWRRAVAGGTGQRNCPCAVPAVKQAPRGCRHEFGGRGPECFHGGGQRPVQLEGTGGGAAAGVQVTVTVQRVQCAR